MSDTWTPAEAEKVIVALGGGGDQIDGVQLTVAQARALAARLAEVEAERDTAAERWINTAKALADAQTERDGLSMQNDLAGERLREMAAERDRLAQELEDAVEAMRKAARGPSPASAVTGFLARFPVEEGSHGR